MSHVTHSPRLWTVRKADSGFRVVRVGTQGPAGPQGATGPQGPPFTMEGVEDVTDWGAIPDGSTDSTDAIIEAYQNAPVGGGLYFPFGTGTYRISDRIQINKPIRIFGDTVVQHQGLIGTYGINVLNLPLDPPYLSGSVIEQTAGGTDVFHVTAAGHSVHFRDLALTFASAIRWTNTGHGINATPTTLFSGRPEMGLHSSWWERVTVYGHDGNHYAFKCVNQLCCRFNDLRFYGGGGLLFVNDCAASNGNMGNLQCDDFYGQLFCNGTAHGAHILATAGTPNMFLFNRCQITTDDLEAVVSGTAAPTAAQYNFYCDDLARRITWMQGDFESNVGGKLRFPTTSYFWDIAGILSNTPEGGPGPITTATGQRYCYAIGDSYGNRGLWTDHRPRVNISTPGEDPLAFHYLPTDVDGPGIYPDGGEATGLVSRANPRPSPRRQDIAYAALDTAPVFSNGTDWSDVAAAPTISALSDIANLAGDFEVNLLGLANGTPISTLNDAVAGNHATAAGSARPTYSTTAATANGKASASFDGTDDKMASALSAGSTNFTDFYVVQVAEVTSNNRDFVDSAGGSGIRTRYDNGSNPQGCLVLNKSGAFGFGSSTYALPTDRVCLVVFRYDGSTVTYRINTTPMGSATGSTTMSASTTTIGGATSNGAPFKGNLFRFVRYNAALTDDQVKSVEKFLRAWGTLP